MSARLRAFANLRTRREIVIDRMDLCSETVKGETDIEYRINDQQVADKEPRQRLFTRSIRHEGLTRSPLRSLVLAAVFLEPGIQRHFGVSCEMGWRQSPRSRGTDGMSMPSTI